jgi:uncharacterized membrane protein (DUF485 family)
MSDSWFPELDRVESKAERKRLAKNAMRPFFGWRRRLYWLVTFPLMFVLTITVAVLLAFCAFWVGLPEGVGILIGIAVGSVVGVMLAAWVFRRRLARNLRQQLLERGHAVCLACGYDLTGNVSGRCPECGEAI